ncbi:hypothetical protein Fmac_029724 [Flemingia macrophylla]|uniref:Uncharacterized protein n=1 Tax=Flemingia macrophylla TaxID=520843 RepID=A0ABD1LB63_9FABA
MSVALDNAQAAEISSSNFGLAFHCSTTDLAFCTLLQTEIPASAGYEEVRTQGFHMIEQSNLSGM